jgi:hypothetical protein
MNPFREPNLFAYGCRNHIKPRFLNRKETFPHIRKDTSSILKATPFIFHGNHELDEFLLNLMLNSRLKNRILDGCHDSLPCMLNRIKAGNSAQPDAFMSIRRSCLLKSSAVRFAQSTPIPKDGK